MIGMVVAVPRPRRRRWWHVRRSLTLRQLARVVAMMQDAEAQNLHANRDRCVPCKVQATKADAAMTVIPRRLVADEDWMHAHVYMPAARRLARIEDRAADA